MLLAIWNCIYVPYSIAFIDGNESLPVFMFNTFTDFLFLADIVVNFRTTYINEETGIETFAQSKIAIQYIKGKLIHLILGRFWIDLLASMPTDIFVLAINAGEDMAQILQMFSLLKLIRVARLSRVIKYLNLKSNLKMSLGLAKLVFFLFLYLH